MKTAKELLEEFTATSFRDPKKAAAMFTDDGAFEMPYLGARERTVLDELESVQAAQVSLDSPAQREA